MPRAQLVEGNSKLEASRSVAQVAGPGLAGVLIQALSAPLAIALDALTFAVSALLIGAIRAPEPRSAVPPQRAIWPEIVEGLRAVAGDPLLRAMTGCGATWNFFGNALFSVYVLYVTRELGVPPAALGAIFAAGSLGALAGTVLAGPAARRFGPGAAMAGAMLLAGAGRLFIPIAGGPLALAVALLVAAQLARDVAFPVYGITATSLRQALTPDRLQGRVGATMRCIAWGSAPAGALLGGLLADHLGLAPTVTLMAVGGLVPPLWILLSPLRGLRSFPEPVAAATPAGM